MLSHAALSEISTYQRLLAINKHKLDEELEVQAEMMYHISEAKARAASRMHAAKDELETVQSRVYLKLRATGVKHTVAEADGHIQQNADRQVAWREFQEARQEYERWEGLFESWKQRGFALKTMADLYLGNYYVVGGAGAPRGSRDTEHEDNRRAMADARRSQHQATTTATRRTVD